jgi:hypothetical protein
MLVRFYFEPKGRKRDIRIYEDRETRAIPSIIQLLLT